MSSVIRPLSFSQRPCRKRTICSCMLLFRQTLHHRCNLEPSQIRRRTHPQISVSLFLGTAGLRFEHTGDPSQHSELLSECGDISFVFGGDLCATDSHWQLWKSRESSSISAPWQDQLLWRHPRQHERTVPPSLVPRDSSSGACMNAAAVLRSVAVPTVHVADVVSACVAQLRNHVRWCVCHQTPRYRHVKRWCCA